MSMMCRISITLKCLFISFIFISLNSRSIIVRSESTTIQNAQSSNTDNPKLTPVSLKKTNSKSNDELSLDHLNEEKENLKNSINCSLVESKNSTFCKQDDSFVRKMLDNTGMLFRTMMVLLGVTSIVVLYFVIRAVRLRKRRSKSRKYGVITRGDQAGDMEMEPLGDGDDDDEDYTVFEMNGRRN